MAATSRRSAVTSRSLRDLCCGRDGSSAPKRRLEWVWDEWLRVGAWFEILSSEIVREHQPPGYTSH